MNREREVLGGRSEVCLGKLYFLSVAAALRSYPRLTVSDDGCYAA